MTSLARNLLLVVLAASYSAVCARLRPAGSGRGFDPLDPRARHVELAIESGRFDEALPAALSLRALHDADPDVRYWLAEIYRGLGRTSDEIQAWHEYERVSATPEEVCPALPLAYVRAGDAAGALREFESCVDRATDDPGQLINLAAEHVRQGHIEEAIRAYRRAGAIDPSDPRVPRRVAELSGSRSE